MRRRAPQPPTTRPDPPRAPTPPAVLGTHLSSASWNPAGCIPPPGAPPRAPGTSYLRLRMKKAAIPWLPLSSPGGSPRAWSEAPRPPESACPSTLPSASRRKSRAPSPPRLQRTHAPLAASSSCGSSRGSPPRRGRLGPEPHFASRSTGREDPAARPGAPQLPAPRRRRARAPLPFLDLGLLLESPIGSPPPPPAPPRPARPSAPPPPAGLTEGPAAEPRASPRQRPPRGIRAALSREPPLAGSEP